jgi:hypothetical protein
MAIAPYTMRGGWYTAAAAAEAPAVEASTAGAEGSDSPKGSPPPQAANIRALPQAANALHRRHVAAMSKKLGMGKEAEKGPRAAGPKHQGAQIGAGGHASRTDVPL